MKLSEPTYAFRRKGLDSFCTCDLSRYEELSAMPARFEVCKLFTESQLHEALEKQQAVMRQALEAIADLAGYRTDVDKAIKALEEALK